MGLVWTIGDCQSINFSTDDWLGSGLLKSEISGPLAKNKELFNWGFILKEGGLWDLSHLLSFSMRNCSSVSFPSLPVFQALNRITESRANPAMVNSPEIVWDIVLSEYHNDCSWGGKGNRELIWKVTATQDLEPFHECATMIDHQQNPTCSGHRECDMWEQWRGWGNSGSPSSQFS